MHGDICGPIHPQCGYFRYFMVLIYASSRWSHVCLLSTRNQFFARLLAQLIWQRAHFPYYPIKKIHFDNDGKFTSHAFNEYYVDWNWCRTSYVTCSYIKWTCIIIYKTSKNDCKTIIVEIKSCNGDLQVYML